MFPFIWLVRHFFDKVKCGFKNVSLVTEFTLVEFKMSKHGTVNITH